MSTVEVNKLRKVLQVFNEQYGVSVNDQDRHKLGKILTVIDASIPDPEQRKAVKDIINNDWWVGVQISAFDVHSEIRKLTEALGFELYPETNDKPMLNTSVAQYNRYEELVK